LTLASFAFPEASITKKFNLGYATTFTGNPFSLRVAKPWAWMFFVTGIYSGAIANAASQVPLARAISKP
jgi:hypothetical protein